LGDSRGGGAMGNLDKNNDFEKNNVLPKIHENKSTQIELELENKSTQTDKNHKVVFESDRAMQMSNLIDSNNGNLVNSNADNYNSEQIVYLLTKKPSVQQAIDESLKETPKDLTQTNQTENVKSNLIDKKCLYCNTSKNRMWRY
jgi:hypothetical protein